MTKSFKAHTREKKIFPSVLPLLDKSLFKNMKSYKLEGVRSKEITVLSILLIWNDFLLKI